MIVMIAAVESLFLPSYILHRKGSLLDFFHKLQIKSFEMSNSTECPIFDLSAYQLERTAKMALALMGDVTLEATTRVASRAGIKRHPIGNWP